MKKITVWFSVLLCIFALTIGVSAEDNLFMLDWADLLTDAEETQLNTYLAEISEKYDANILVATVDSLEGTDAQSYADDLYEAGLAYHGLANGTEDGALLLVAMNDRQWAISTMGYGITAVTEPVLDWMEYEIVPLLSEGAYFEAFSVFGALCEESWQDAAEHYGEDSYYDEDFYYNYDTVTAYSNSVFLAARIFISLVVGFLIALIPMSMLKSQLNSVKMQSGAVFYQKQASVRITGSKDLFLYRNLTKKPIPRDPPSGGSRPGGSIHHSSSGRAHGGRSGGF